MAQRKFLATRAARKSAPVTGGVKKPRHYKKTSTMATNTKRTGAQVMATACTTTAAARALFGRDTLSATEKRLAVACGALKPEIFALMVKALSSCSTGSATAVADAAHALLDENTQRVYSPSEPRVYGAYQGCEYHKPCGWVRWNVSGIPGDAPCFGWSVGYHGTRPDHLMAIVDAGLLSPADRQAVALHGQAGTTADTKNKTIYTSPCIGYSAHPVYTPLIKTSGDRAAQILLQVRVNQDAVFRRLKTTLGKLYWADGVPFEAGFSLDDDMEWLVANKDELVVTGVLFRELGCKTDEDRARYGEAACSFSAHGDAPQYAWTKHLADTISRRGTHGPSL